jgi:hypothetical protein
LSERIIGIEDGEVEVEYQSDTIGKYGMEFSNGNFHLVVKQTACLASDNCGIPAEKQKLSLSSLTPAKSCCDPKTGCC